MVRQFPVSSFLVSDRMAVPQQIDHDYVERNRIRRRDLIAGNSKLFLEAEGQSTTDGACRLHEIERASVLSQNGHVTFRQ